ncbi:hypothetical protein BBJ28_00022599 [Nothophytophthora sp. Chile5]|nr:hypothetical protein BBJ28_00022599 [Nothophytophthora sp. Chile5]
MRVGPVFCASGSVDPPIHRLFVTKQTSLAGAYALRLFQNCQREAIFVGDFFPVVDDSVERETCIADVEVSESAGGEEKRRARRVVVQAVVLESISRENFRRWLDDHEGKLRHWEYEPVTAGSGRVIVYSFPSRVHERTAGKIMLAILKQVEEADNATALTETFGMEYAPTIYIGDRDQEPNGSLTPDAADIDAFPNLIVEIAYSQLWDDLVAKLERWIGPNTTVQIAIGVKVDRPNRRIILLQRDGQDVTHTDVDFAVGEPAPVSFPLRALYYGVALPDALVGHEDDPIWIGLAWLRGVIDRFP